MARQFSEAEARQFVEAEKILKSRGLITSDEDGAELALNNGQLLQSFFDINPTIPVTVKTVLDAVERMKKDMHWKSAVHVEYDGAYNALTKSQQDIFGAWWYSASTKRTIVIDGDEGFSNAAKILNWCRGRAFTDSTFNLAVSNLAGSRGLYLVQESTFRPSPHTGGDSSFLSKKDTNLTAREHSRLAAEAQAAASGQKPAPTTDFRALAEAVKGPTHSRTEQIQKAFVTEGGQISWEKTYNARRKMAGL